MSDDLLDIKELAKAANLSPDRYAEKIVRDAGNNIALAASRARLSPSVVKYWLTRRGLRVQNQPVLVPIEA